MTSIASSGVARLDSGLMHTALPSCHQCRLFMDQAAVKKTVCSETLFFCSFRCYRAFSAVKSEELESPDSPPSVPVSPEPGTVSPKGTARELLQALFAGRKEGKATLGRTRSASNLLALPKDDAAKAKESHEPGVKRAPLNKKAIVRALSRVVHTKRPSE